jgi:hypothetical protein
MAEHKVLTTLFSGFFLPAHLQEMKAANHVGIGGYEGCEPGPDICSFLSLCPHQCEASDLGLLR